MRTACLCLFLAAFAASCGTRAADGSAPGPASGGSDSPTDASMDTDAAVEHADAQGGSAGSPPDAPVDSADESSGGDADSPVPPPKPADLVTYVAGNPGDADVVPSGPGLVLMGGGTDVDDAFLWWKGLLHGGDVVVLRTSGADGYNDYLLNQIGGCDSVETLLVTTRPLADDPYVAWTVAHAEGIFIAGGDQATYLETWKGTSLQAAVQQAWSRGAVVGGTSAGCAVLGQYAFAAYQDTVYSDEALSDPYNSYMTMERDFLTLPPLAGAITDTHFAQRDRMGRLVAFLARIEQDGWGDPVRGIGVDENTALVVGPDGAATVMGSGLAYVVESNGAPQECTSGTALLYAGLTYHKLAAGDSIELPAGQTSAPAIGLSAHDGQLEPPDPY
jgi:cyanophycinase